MLMVLVGLALGQFLVAKNAAGQQRYCDNPSSRPTRLVRWSEGLPAWKDQIATDGTHLFVQSLTQPADLHRYSLDGQVHDIWPRATTGIYNSPTLAFGPNGDLYASNGDGVFVFDPDRSGVPKTVLFTGPRGTSPGSFAQGPGTIAFHPESGDLYVMDDGWFFDGQEDTWISRIQRFDQNG